MITLTKIALPLLLALPITTASINAIADCGSSGDVLIGLYHDQLRPSPELYAAKGRDYPCFAPYAFKKSQDYWDVVDRYEWDYALTVKLGETLEDIALEVYEDPWQWIRIIDNNTTGGYGSLLRGNCPEDQLVGPALTSSVNPSQTLESGTELLVYFTGQGLRDYMDSHPDRKIVSWMTDSLDCK